MQDSLKIEAGVSIECKQCGVRSTVPAIHVKTGTKCEHCGKPLCLSEGDIVARDTMLKAALVNKNVKID